MSRQWCAHSSFKNLSHTSLPGKYVSTLQVAMTQTNRQTPEGKNSIIYVKPAVFRDNENSGLEILLTPD